MGEHRAVRHPVFVYGTLRSGEPGHHLIGSGASVSAGARLRGAALAVAPSGWYPYLYLTRDHREVTGELVRLDPAGYETTLAALDEWEEFHGAGHPDNEYERMLLAVLVGSAEVLAWVYTVDPSRTDGLGEIASGDWLDRS